MPGNRILCAEAGPMWFRVTPPTTPSAAGSPARAAGVRYRTRRQVWRLQITLSTQPATSTMSGPFGVRLPE